MFRRHIERPSLGTRDYPSRCQPPKPMVCFNTSTSNSECSRLTLHDLRKAYITGFCLAGVPLEVEVDLNAGWKDMNTAKKYYLHIKALNAGHEYQKFESMFFA